ncbi:MAG: T9SS type A sorting domain-containing protein [Flavobacteriales bacterium]|nr:T9SS type A sorting domain-containing protein [Flavobacteriales bacterium]MBP9080981.1 T9SS type A sorting domain-containing protein [Flavobacteriales bacterium]
MKKTILLLATASLAPALQAQTPVTVSTGGGSVEQHWYSLQNDVAGVAALDEWDLAFEMAGFTSAIRVNAAKGLVAYETPNAITDWDNVNSVDTANWTLVQDSDSSWSVSALSNGNNLSNPDGLNVGWGDYNMITHVITGTKIYAILLADGTTWKKLRINALASGIFSFTYANLDGSGTQEASLSKTGFTGKNFGYWSFATNGTLDREPLATDWDLLFTKYVQLTPYVYPVVGVLLNKEVTALQVDGVPSAQALWSTGTFSEAINVLGSDWKTYDFAQSTYVMAADRTYFVKDVPGNIWKVVFTGFGGSANGNISFTKEMMSAVGVGENTAQQHHLFAWPNPVTDGQARLVLDLPVNEALVRVFNTAGQQVAQQPWTGLAGLTTRTLDVGGLAKGVYMVRVDAAGTSTSTKLVIE